MSNDPHQPEPGQGKTPPKTSKSSGELTETDLWDLDRSMPRKDFDSGKSEALPPRRKDGSKNHQAGSGEVGEARPYVHPVRKPAAPSTVAQPDVYADPENPAHPPETPADEKVVPAEATASVTETPNSTASLTKTEKIAITVVFAAILLGAAFAVIHFNSRVPLRSPISEKTDFPVSGKLIEVKSATTYWRKPVTSGDDPDIVRRGTALIPVAKLSLSSKPCAIRVFFRDEDGTVIGDGISRNVSGEQELVIPATAGFDDIGMHAAYRTGEKEPWIIQVFEGPSRSADRDDFKKVLETEISTDRR